jgi:hypothetical protein
MCSSTCWPLQMTNDSSSRGTVFFIHQCSMLDWVRLDVDLLRARLRTHTYQPSPAALVALQILRRRDSLGSDDSNSGTEMARMLTCAYFRSCVCVVIWGSLCVRSMKRAAGSGQRAA